MTFDRSVLFDDNTLQGTAFTEAHTDYLDSFIRGYVDEMGMPPDTALVAVGGYGRGEMSPGSDLDLALVHRPQADVTTFVQEVWYPIWDAGIKLGQTTDTIPGLLRLAFDDLDTATAILSARYLTGDESIAHELAMEARRLWRADPQRSISRLSDRVKGLHEEHGEVAFTLGPDLKLGRGGLRDVHALNWLVATGALADARALNDVQGPFEMLTKTRVALHRAAGRSADRLMLDYQEDVAEQLGYANADDLITDVSAAARSIAWSSDATWFWVEHSMERRRRASDRQLIDGDIHLDGWLLSLDPEADIAGDPTTLFRVARVAARRRAFIEHDTLTRLAKNVGELPDPWTSEMRQLFVETLTTGHAAVRVMEALDQVGLMSVLIPEWEPCQSKPQRNAYHRFTVDRHLLEAAAEAALRSDQVQRPDLLIVGALLHDIGKGYPGDHTDVGVEMIPTIARRMGFSDVDANYLVDMCRHHLLLPDAATRRDLDDNGTIQSVADAVGSLELLELLAALTESDSIATGPSAWNASKAELVSTLVSRVAYVLGGGAASEIVEDRFPTVEQRALMSAGKFAVSVQEDTITIVQSDRPGAFSRAAGVLTLNGLDILAAAAIAENDMALSEFEVDSVEQSDLNRLEAQLSAGASSQLALDARVDERRETYARTRRRVSAQAIIPSITIDNETSNTHTVIEVSGPDDIGLLYRIARALLEVGTAISNARIQTIGDTVVDSFYVTYEGNKIEAAEHLREIERAVLHSILRK